MLTRILASLLAGTVVGLAVLALGGLREPFELAVYDALLRREVTRASPIVLIIIDEEDIREQGHWPISDGTLARACLMLIRAGAAAVGLDLYRDLPVSPGVDAFRRVLREEPRIIAVKKFGALDGEGIPGPPALADADRVAFNDLLPDFDQRVRRGLLYMDDGEGAVQMSFALRLALEVLMREGIAPAPDDARPEWMRLGATTFAPLEKDQAGYSDLDAGGYQFLLDYGAVGFESYSLSALLRGEVAADRLEGRIVLIGSRAKSLPDMFGVPVGAPIAGVEVHAQMVDQILRTARGQALPRRAVARAFEILAVLAAAVLGCAVGLGLGGGRVVGFAAAVGMVLFGLVVLLGTAMVFFSQGWWIPIVGPSLAWVAGGALTNAWLSNRERAQRAELMRLFAHSVSPRVADEIWEHRAELFSEGRLRPRQLVATTLFVDMIGYTETLRKLPPEQVMDWVNEFMRRMTEIIDAAGGFVDDFFGDGIKADFGLPIPRTTDEQIADDARAASRCALGMAKELVGLNLWYKARGLPEVTMRIGIATGSVVSGSIGGAGRIKYTDIGEPCVVAQRLQATGSLEHDFSVSPCRILVTSETRRNLGEGFDLAFAGVVQLKGLDDCEAWRLLGGEGV